MNIFPDLISWLLGHLEPPCACTIVEDDQSIKYHVLFKLAVIGKYHKQGGGKTDI